MKMMSIKLEDWFYDQGKEYAKFHNSSFAGMCRFMLEDAFFERMNRDITNLEMTKRMLANPEKYELTTREIAYWQNQLDSLSAAIEKFSDFRADLASHIQKQVNENA